MKSQTQSCDLFIAYRQGHDEGDACAAWLHDNLEGSAIRFNDERLASIKIYWDRDAPAISDWRVQWRTALKTCRGLILVCTPGTRERRQPHDWLFEELDWWLSHRRTAPLLVDAGASGSTCVPPAVAKKWEYAQRLSWNAANSESELHRLISQIRDGIVVSESGIRNEELASSIRKKRVMTALGVGLLYLSIGVLVLAFIKSALGDCITAVETWSRSGGHMGPDFRLDPSSVCSQADSLVLFAEVAGIFAGLLSGFGLIILWMVSWLRHRKRHI